MEEANENSISASGGLSDAVRLHQQRQPQSACENNCGGPARVDDDSSVPRRQRAALSLKRLGNSRQLDESQLVG
jgi:hypothetical protein